MASRRTRTNRCSMTPVVGMSTSGPLQFYGSLAGKATQGTERVLMSLGEKNKSPTPAGVRLLLASRNNVLTSASYNRWISRCSIALVTEAMSFVSSTGLTR